MIQTVFKDRKLSSHSSSRKSSRSLSQRRGRLDSEGRGDSSITVQWWEDRTVVLSVQKIAEMLQVKSTGKRVDDTEIMRTSSRQSKLNSEQWEYFRFSSSNATEWWTLQLCNRQRRSFLWHHRDWCRTLRRSRSPLRSSKLCRDSAHHPVDPKDRWGITGTVHGWDARCDERQGRANQTCKKTWRLSQI